jgi:thioredoxin reductase
MEEYEYAIIGQGASAFAAAIKSDETGIKTIMVGKMKLRGLYWEEPA